MEKDFHLIESSGADFSKPWLKMPVIKMEDTMSWFAKVYKGGRVLDVGGGNRLLQRIANIPDSSYEVIDNDKAIKPTHLTWKTVRGEYDYIVMFAVIEHIPLNLFRNWLAEARKHLKKEGTLIITTPNVHNLYVFDHDHIIFYKPTKLAGIVHLAGFEPEIYRCYNVVKNPLVRLVQMFVRTPFSYLLEIDFNCPNVMIIARLKKASYL